MLLNILDTLKKILKYNKNKIPKRKVLKLFEGIYASKLFTVEEAHKAFSHITPEYIKEYRTNKENKMNDTKLNEVDEESLNNLENKKEKQQLEFLDERVRLDFSEEENLTDNVNIE